MSSMNNDVSKIAKNVFGKWLHAHLSDTLRRRLVESACSERERVCLHYQRRNTTCYYCETSFAILKRLSLKLQILFSVWRRVFKWHHKKTKPLLPLLHRILVYNHLTTSVVDMAYLNYWQASVSGRLLMLSYLALFS
jgi:hypothetical protein